MDNSILIDSSYLIALFNPKDQYHRQALEFVESNDFTFFIPDVVLVEVVYMLQVRVGLSGAMQFHRYLIQNRPDIECLSTDDIERVYEIRQKYEQFDFVDSCIMALSERLNITKIATFDRRDFSVFRPAHCEFFDLILPLIT